MLPDFTLFLKQVHMDEIYELLSTRMLPAYYLNAKIKKGDFFPPLRRSRSYHVEVQPRSPRHRAGAVPSPLPSATPSAAPPAAAALPRGCRQQFQRGGE